MTIITKGSTVLDLTAKLPMIARREYERVILVPSDNAPIYLKESQVLPSANTDVNIDETLGSGFSVSTNNMTYVIWDGEGYAFRSIYVDFGAISQDTFLGLISKYRIILNDNLYNLYVPQDEFKKFVEEVYSFGGTINEDNGIVFPLRYEPNPGFAWENLVEDSLTLVENEGEIPDYEDDYEDEDEDEEDIKSTKTTDHKTAIIYTIFEEALCLIRDFEVTSPNNPELANIKAIATQALTGAEKISAIFDKREKDKDD